MAYHTRYLEQLSEVGAAVGDVGRVLQQAVDDHGEVGQALVDEPGLLQRLPRRPRLVLALRACAGGEELANTQPSWHLETTTEGCRWFCMHATSWAASSLGGEGQDCEGQSQGRANTCVSPEGRHMPAGASSPWWHTCQVHKVEHCHRPCGCPLARLVLLHLQVDLEDCMAARGGLVHGRPCCVPPLPAPRKQLQRLLSCTQAWHSHSLSTPTSCTQPGASQGRGRQAQAGCQRQPTAAEAWKKLRAR